MKLLRGGARPAPLAITNRDPVKALLDGNVDDVPEEEEDEDADATTEAMGEPSLAEVRLTHQRAEEIQATKWARERAEAQTLKRSSASLNLESPPTSARGSAKSLRSVGLPGMAATRLGPLENSIVPSKLGFGLQSF